MFDDEIIEGDAIFKLIDELNAPGMPDDPMELDGAILPGTCVLIATTDAVEIPLVLPKPVDSSSLVPVAEQRNGDVPTGALTQTETCFECSDKPEAGGAADDSVDYADFKFEAFVDWIEVLVKLPALSQPQHVRGRMPSHWHLPYVSAETDDPSRTAAGFTFRVQNPTGPVAFLRDAQSIVQSGQPPLAEHDIEIKAIEVSFDAYSTGQDQAALVQMTEAMIWTQTLMASVPRICPTFDRPGISSKKNIRRALQSGWSINAGDVGSAFAQRWYVKSKDSLGGDSHAPLPTVEHRARAEVTLRGSRLPFTTLADWRQFRFETLRTPYFSWRLPRESARTMHTLPPWLEQFKSLGRVEGSARGRKDRRKTKPGTMPNSVLQQKAKNALERLTRLQRRG